MINWQYFPKSDDTPDTLRRVVDVFEAASAQIDSSTHEDQRSNTVLAIVRPGLEEAGFQVEKGKRGEEKIRVPVLFGRNGHLEKYFEADAVHSMEGIALEVEAGRGLVNNDFLKHLFQACMMHDIHYFCVAVRNQYRGTPDFDRVMLFIDTLYASRRLQLPLKGILVIGY